MQNISNSDWRVLPEFPGYAITPDGQVWSYKRNKFLKLCPDKGGYLKVNLCNDLGRTFCTVHRLVGIAFIPLPEEFKGDYSAAVINHKDHNRHNNHYTNLEWVTLSYNSQEAWINGYMDHHKKKPSFCVSIEDKTFTDFDSARDIDRYLNLPKNTVANAINKTNGVIQGKYIVGYVEDFDWGYLLQDQGIDAFIQTYSDAIDNFKPRRKECFLIDLLDNTRRPFDSYSDIDRDLNLPIGTTARAIYKTNGLIQGRYIAGSTDDFRWKGIFDKCTVEQIVESYADQIERYKPRNRGPKKITNLQTGESRVYNSLSDFAEEKGIHPSGVHRYLKNHSDLYSVELV